MNDEVKRTSKVENNSFVDIFRKEVNFIEVTRIYIEIDVSKSTFVNDRFLLTEVREGGKFRDAILFRKPLVVDLNKVYTKRVCIVIYLLQFF